MADTLNDVPVPSPSSPSAAPQDRAPAPQQTSGDPSPAPSPGADKGETRETLLEAVTKAVPELRADRDGQDQPSGAPLAPGTQADTAAAPKPAEPELPDEVSQDELSQLSPGVRRRLNKLVDQRRSLRSEVENLRRTLSPGAEAAEQVSKYLQDNDIGIQDFNQLLKLGADLRRGDFRSFYEGVKPYMELAEQYLGLALPKDLQQVVQQGQMTPQAAALYHRERMDRALSDTQRMRQAQMIDQRDNAVAEGHLRQSVEASVNAWEASVTASDPDYALKKAAVGDAIWSVINERGRPQSPEHAVAIAQEAYRRVNTHYQSWAPPPRRATFRQPSSTGRPNGASPEPRNLREAVEQAIAARA